MVVTDKDRDEIKQMAGRRLSMTEIGLIKKMDRNTIRKYCKTEMAQGKAMAKLMAVNQIFINIKNGKEASLIFYLKTQHQWKESVKIEAHSQVVHSMGVLKESPLTAIEWEQNFAETSTTTAETTDLVGTTIGAATRTR